MKKYLILACSALFFATSCLMGGGSSGSSSSSYYGKLTVSDISTGEVSYSINDALVEVSIPDVIVPKFDFIFNNVKFDAAMPVQLCLEISNVPFVSTVSEDETMLNYIFKGENIVPTVGGKAYDKYKVSIIEGCVSTTVDITFVIPEKNKRVYFTTAKDGIPTPEN